MIGPVFSLADFGTVIHRLASAPQQLWPAILGRLGAAFQAQGFDLTPRVFLLGIPIDGHALESPLQVLEIRQCALGHVPVNLAPHPHNLLYFASSEPAVSHRVTFQRQPPNRRGLGISIVLGVGVQVFIALLRGFRFF